MIFQVDVPAPLPQTDSPSGHTQPVGAHDAPVAQTLPQPRQFDGSLAMFTQVEPHTFGSPGGQVHAPALQTSFVSGQTLPQPLQFCASLWKSVQKVPQELGSGAWQAHAPFAHRDPACTVSQTFPHRPQLALLVLRSIQSCPQAQVPSGQVQVPAVQVWFSPHRLPHEPQLVMLVRRSSHRP